MIKMIVLLFVILAAVGFGIQYLPADASIKRLIVGITIFLAILFVLVLVLSLFGVMQIPSLSYFLPMMSILR